MCCVSESPVHLGPVCSTASPWWSCWGRCLHHKGDESFCGSEEVCPWGPPHTVGAGPLDHGDTQRTPSAPTRTDKTGRWSFTSIRGTRCDTNCRVGAEETLSPGRNPDPGLCLPAGGGPGGMEGGGEQRCCWGPGSQCCTAWWLLHPLDTLGRREKHSCCSELWGLYTCQNRQQRWERANTLNPQTTHTQKKNTKLQDNECTQRCERKWVERCTQETLSAPSENW